MIKEKIIKLVGLDMQEELPLDAREQMIQVDVDREIKWQEMTQHEMPFNCFGIHYSLKYLKTHTPAEVQARWKSDIATLKRILEEYRYENAKEEAQENSKKVSKDKKSKSQTLNRVK